MKTKTYAILDVLIIVVILFLLAFCCGCKDEAEAKDPNLEIIDITGYKREYPIDLRLYDVTNEGELGDCATFTVGGDTEIICDTRKEKYLRILFHSLSGKEPNRPVTLRFQEPNEPEIYFKED